jgi:hypothetical protein
MKGFLFFIFLPTLLTFGFGPGETGYNFLKLGIGARPVAMGSAFTAVSDDANAIFWNPGGIALFPDFSLTLMVMNLFTDVTYGALGTKVPIGRRLGLGMGGGFLSAKDTRRDELGEEAGEYYFNNFLFTTSFACSPFRNFATGFALKGVGARLDTFSSYSLALDWGTIYSPYRNLFLGACLFNLGTPQKFISESDLLPVTLRFGSCYKIPIFWHQLLLATDLRIPIDSKVILSLGGELTLKNIPQKDEFFSLRAGYETGYHLGTWKGFSFGIGYGKRIAPRFYLVLDAAHFDYGYVGASERVSISLQFK